MTINKFLSTLSDIQAFLRLVGLGEVEANQRIDAAATLTALAISLDIINTPYDILLVLNNWYATPQYTLQDLAGILRRLKQVGVNGKIAHHFFYAKKKSVV
ncbi:hypothetical protein [Weissella cibaria]|uniref:hypothetical protein n=1 Tax=Weissella cibaria TaxID=137591 RepID=UPI000706466A|nr:hypothetical protein [Weissella cibaria]ALI33925.1 hypothetical protein AO080_10945 [Weissella cibaria]